MRMGIRETRSRHQRRVEGFDTSGLKYVDLGFETIRLGMNAFVIKMGHAREKVDLFERIRIAAIEC